MLRTRLAICSTPASGWHNGAGRSVEGVSLQGPRHCCICGRRFQPARAAWYEDDVNSSNDSRGRGPRRSSHDWQPSRSSSSSGGRNSNDWSRSRQGDAGRGGRGGPGRDRPAGGRQPNRVQQSSRGQGGSPDAQELGPAGSFNAMLATLQATSAEQQVIRKEAWEKLLALVETPQHAEAVLGLIKQDAAVREATAYDWNTHGYGQTVLQLVAVASSVGADELAEQVVAAAPQLHLNTGSKEFVGALMRKMVGAGAGSQPLEKLYALEKQLRGSNTHMAAHELSRAYRREESTRGVRSLVEQAAAGQVELKPQLLEDLALWLSKRGVVV